MRTRPKTLPPTLRDKRRYVAFRVIGERSLKREEVKKAIGRAALETLGVVGTAKAAPWLVEFNEETQEGIIQVNREHVEDVRFAVTLIRNVGGSRVIFRTLGVSGTMKRLRKKFLGHD